MSAVPTTEGAGIWGKAGIHAAYLLPLLPVQSHPWLPSGDEERGEDWWDVPFSFLGWGKVPIC